MEEKLLNKKELCKRWGIAPATLDRRIRDKTVTPVKGLSPIRFTMSHILQVEGVEVDRLSPLERKRMEREKTELERTIESLKHENEQLRSIIGNVLTESSKIINF